MKLIKAIFEYFKPVEHSRDVSNENGNVERYNANGLPVNKQYLIDLLFKYDALRDQMNNEGAGNLNYIVYGRSSLGKHVHVDIGDFKFYGGLSYEYVNEKRQSTYKLTIELVDKCFDETMIIYNDRYDGIPQYRKGSWTDALINVVSKIEDEILIMQDLLDERDKLLLAERTEKEQMIESHFYNKYDGINLVSSVELLDEAIEQLKSSRQKIHSGESFDLMDKATTNIHKAYWISKSEVCR